MPFTLLGTGLMLAVRANAFRSGGMYNPVIAPVNPVQEKPERRHHLNPRKHHPIEDRQDDERHTNPNTGLADMRVKMCIKRRRTSR
jgi:hypothetical protein